jgi:phosphatidylglycerol:prolipoprotein diacylglycerol transferase
MHKKKDDTRVGFPHMGVILYITVFAAILPALHFFFGLSMDILLYNPISKRYVALYVAGALITSAGASISFAAVYLLRKRGKGWPVSPVPPKKLVTTGIYRLSRHPIYLGATVGYAGVSLAVHSFWNCVLFSPLFGIFFLSYAQGVEEPVLARRFGNSYNRYSQSVPIFLPYPLRISIRKAVAAFLTNLSRLANRPLILQWRNHILFLGYGLWCGVAAMAGLAMMNWLMNAYSTPSNTVRILIILATGFTILGSRVVWVVAIMIHEKRSLSQTLNRVGFVSWGMVLGVLIISLPYVLLARKSVFMWFDISILSLALMHFFGRLGCLFYGCCYGRETSSKACISYSHSALKAVRESRVDTRSLFPVQIFSAFYGLAIFLIIFLSWYYNDIQVGLPTTLVCILYTLFRFSEEQYRAQKARLFGLLSPSQCVCIFVIVGCIVQTAILLFWHDGLMHASIQSTGVNPLENNMALIAGMGVLSTLFFSYHYREVGKWGTDRNKR